jgi:ribosome maturation factor RimP
MELVEEIKQLARQALNDESRFIVDIVISSRKSPRKVLVIVDGDNGVTIDDCADLSTALSKALDETQLIEDNYFLEVSTPGLDQPLKLHRQYKKNIGRNLKVKLHEGIREGKLTGVFEDGIELVEKTGKKETNIIKIPFSEIEKAFVTVSFK